MEEETGTKKPDTLTIAILPGDLKKLQEIAEKEWRTDAQQASALLQKALAEHEKRTETISKLKTAIANNKSQNGVSRGRVLAEAT